MSLTAYLTYIFRGGKKKGLKREGEVNSKMIKRLPVIGRVI